MKATLEWVSYTKLIDKDYFYVSANLYEFEKLVLMKTGVKIESAGHSTRRFEYPWAYFQAGNGDRCLDAGGGLNPFSFSLAERYKEVTILDIDAGAIHNLNRIIKFGGFNMLAVKGDLREMSYPDDYFDDVFCISVLEHGPINPNIVDAVKELFRVTKRKLIVTMDVGKKGTPSGPLSINQLAELFKYLNIKTGDMVVDCIMPDEIEPFAVACITVEKNLNTARGM